MNDDTASIGHALPWGIRRKHARTALSYAMVLLLVLLVDQLWGWSGLLSVWSTLSLDAAAGALALILSSYVIRAFRVYDYYRADAKGRFLLCLRLILLNNVFNSVLPMRSGEVSFPLLLNRYFRLPITDTVATLLWFRFLDLQAIIVVAAIAFSAAWSPSGYLTALVVLALLSMPILLFRVKRVITRRMMREPDGRLMRVGWKVLISGPATLPVLLRSWLFSLANWVLKLAVLGLVLQELYPMPISAALSGVIGGELSSILPIHMVGGFGTYEAGMLAALLPFGIDIDLIVPACIGLHLLVLGAGLLGGIFGFLIPVADAEARRIVANEQRQATAPPI